MLKSKLFVILILVALAAAAGTATYYFIGQPKQEAQAQRTKFFNANPDDYPTTGGAKMKVEF